MRIDSQLVWTGLSSSEKEGLHFANNSRLAGLGIKKFFFGMHTTQCTYSVHNWHVLRDTVLDGSNMCRLPVPAYICRA